MMALYEPVNLEACMILVLTLRKVPLQAGERVSTPWGLIAMKTGAQIDSVYTNTGYAGAYRGFGNTEVCSGIEQAIDEMADLLKIDPIEFRLKNCLKVGDVTPHGQLLSEN